MYRALPGSDYYEGSDPYRDRQPTVGLPPITGMACQHSGAVADGSHVHHVPVDRIGAQLCPGSITTPTPQAFSVASQPVCVSRRRSRVVIRKLGAYCTPAPIHQI
jgi:hypothetical protein